MAGGFAHITAAARAFDHIDEATGLSSADKLAVSPFLAFIEVGSVAPDYPYLGRQGSWADRMHYRNTGEVIRNGIRVLRGIADPAAHSRCLAWLLGYAAHVATDLTIHPIVERRVGPYAENKTAHRSCEMNQDAFIWPQRNLGEIGLADYFRINIGQCSTVEGEFNPDVSGFWLQVLEQTYPEDFAAEPPEIHDWNKGFRRIVDTIDDLGGLVSFTRHLLASRGIAYPGFDDVDFSYIENLATPEGPKHYNEVFDRAVASIIQVWSAVGAALNAPMTADLEAALANIPDGDLDTGLTLADKRMIFWGTS